MIVIEPAPPPGPPPMPAPPWDPVAKTVPPSMVIVPAAAPLLPPMPAALRQAVAEIGAPPSLMAREALFDAQTAMPAYPHPEMNVFVPSPAPCNSTLAPFPPMASAARSCGCR